MRRPMSQPVHGDPDAGWTTRPNGTAVEASVSAADVVSREFCERVVAVLRSSPLRLVRRDAREVRILIQFLASCFPKEPT